MVQFPNGVLFTYFDPVSADGPVTTTTIKQEATRVTQTKSVTRSTGEGNGYNYAPPSSIWKFGAASVTEASVAALDLRPLVPPQLAETTPSLYSPPPNRTPATGARAEKPQTFSPPVSSESNFKKPPIFSGPVTSGNKFDKHSTFSRTVTSGSKLEKPPTFAHTRPGTSEDKFERPQTLNVVAITGQTTTYIENGQAFVKYPVSTVTKSPPTMQSQSRYHYNIDGQLFSAGFPLGEASIHDILHPSPVDEDIFYSTITSLSRGTTNIMLATSALSSPKNSRHPSVKDGRTYMASRRIGAPTTNKYSAPVSKVFFDQPGV